MLLLVVLHHVCGFKSLGLSVIRTSACDVPVAFYQGIMTAAIIRQLLLHLASNSCICSDCYGRPCVVLHL